MKTLTLNKEKEIVNQGNYDLVKGEFTHEEASEIVNDLFSKKINFNKQKRFSQHIRFGEHDARIDQRINDLEEAHAEARQIISQAKANEKNVRLSSNILVEIL